MASRDRFDKVQREHVEQACRALLGATAGGGGSYFVRFQGKDLPAKRVLKDAYKLANGVEVSSREFSGGLYTQKILERLGFEVIVRASATDNG